jgi:hypothetical protein
LTFQNAAERAGLQELIKEENSDESDKKSSKTRKKRSNVTATTKKLPGASLLSGIDDSLAIPADLMAAPVKAEPLTKPSQQTPLIGKRGTNVISAGVKVGNPFGLCTSQTLFFKLVTA